MSSLSSLYQGTIVPATTLIPIGAGIIYYKQISAPLRVLLGYLCIALAINLAGIWMASRQINNLPLLHVYTMFELLAVMLYYKYAFDNKTATRWISLVMIVYPILCVINFTFIQSIYTFNTYTRPLEALIIIVCSAIYFAGIDSPSTTQSGKWVAGGLMMYFCSSFIQFTFANVVSHYANKSQKYIIWNIHATFVLMMYLLFFVAILHGRNKR